MHFKKTIAVLLLFAFVSTIVTTLPITVNAQATPTMKTYPIIEAIPNPVGRGEQTLIRTGILQQAASVNYGWTGVTVTVVRPDNTTETLGPFKTDSTGATFTIYTPTQVGTYKLTTHFPQQTNPVGFLNYESGAFIAAGTIMQASTSETIDLIVNEEPTRFYPDQPLPAEYWSRPIDPQLRSWYSISGNWVERPDNSLALYNDDAPETAHVLWARPLTTGGLAGGLFGEDGIPATSETGDAYEGKFPGSVILNGILYYQRTDSRRETAPAIIAIDLHTGEEWLFRNNTVLSFGQVFWFDSYNYDGVFTYIWSVVGNTWIAYDPFTGNEQMRITNMPSGVRARGPKGEILLYQIDYANRWLALWNSTDCGLQNAVIGTPDYGSWGNTAHGGSLNTTKGLVGTDPRSYSWNVTIPAGLAASSSFFTPILKVFPDRVMSVVFNLTQVRVWAVSTEPGRRGQLLFDKTWKAPAEWLEGSNTLHYVGATNEAKNGVIAIWNKELRKHYAFSTETGEYLWQTESEHYANAYGWGNVEHTWYFAYDHLYSTGVSGILYAYDLKTGKTDWTYELTDPYNEPVTGENWWGWISLIADGKLYVGTLEHSAENPLPRGAPFICLNATDGSVIWRVNGMFRQTRWGGNAIIGDSIIATMDTYDQRVYAIGKGPSAITATAPDVSVELGKSVIIKGTVTDISPGTKDSAIAMRFPNGVAAVSDESQSDWMLYVYKQFSCPANVTGVPVTIDVIDANGNYRNIGTTTSDGTGFYSFAWEPDIPGKYTVLATFGGSKAYYPSTAQTAFVVDEAPPASAAPTETPPSVADMYFIPMSIGILVAIIVIGAILALLLLRKRP
ncbi:MAG: PQQ-binding-like beta-propeller repeat protein [Candidatus Bathyarchaeota archaeon]|nr:PQQ-binding-like beta-propeller repeat protein [Candidatus Bathyarchaeota archaeon]